MIDGFSFFYSFFAAAQELDEKNRLRFYDAIIRYGFTVEEPNNLTGAAKAMFLLVKPVLDKSRSKSEAGKLGGQARSKKTASTQQNASRPQANCKQTASDISEDTEKDEEKDTDAGYPPQAPQGACEESANAVDSRFESFWDAYPRKEKKAAAEEAWQRLCPSEEQFAAIMTGLENAIRNSEQWKRDNGHYIPFPANWLLQKRWTDEYTPRIAEADKPATGSFDTDDFFEAACRRSYIDDTGDGIGDGSDDDANDAVGNEAVDGSNDGTDDKSDDDGTDEVPVA